ncbi:MAG TPA: response regulator transcription factor [Oligoflexia bacterium]|nr:response regulator transcription factor [Oligoflexia bacterium]
MKARILVVEDETDIRDLMLLHLKRDGYEVDSVDNGEEALKKIENENYSLIVLDWMLPGISGLDVCKKIQNKAIPVLMVTARADTADIVVGLEMGADDYITKPFELPIFNARVRALLRRLLLPRNLMNAQTFEVGALRVRVDAHEVLCDNNPIQLTTSEFKLLVALLANQGKVLSRSKLVEMVQGEGVSVVDRTVDTHVFGLRKKLGPCAEVIETIRGVGYRVQSN